MVQYRSQRKWRGWIKGRGPSPNVSEVLAAEVEYEKRTRVSCRGKQAKAGGGVGAEHICFFFFFIIAFHCQCEQFKHRCLGVANFIIRYEVDDRRMSIQI